MPLSVAANQGNRPERGSSKCKEGQSQVDRLPVS